MVRHGAHDAVPRHRRQGQPVTASPKTPDNRPTLPGGRAVYFLAASILTASTIKATGMAMMRRKTTTSVTDMRGL
jgi:hypothetical protein